MADPATKQSPLTGLDLPTGNTVTVRERPFLGKLILRGVGSDFHNAVTPVLGTDLPAPLHSVTSDGRSVLWQGPDNWLIVADVDTIRRTDAALRTALTGLHAAVIDVSAGSTVLRLAGPAAREVLSKGCALDLDPPAFNTGTCTPTRIAAFAVTLVQVTDSPAYDLYVARSLARTFAEWLVDACRQFTADA